MRFLKERIIKILMQPNELDVKGTETPADSSTEDKTTPNGSEADETLEELGSDSEKFNSRFKEVYASKKEAERKVAELEAKLKESPKELPDGEPQTWDDVYDRAATKLEIKQQQRETELQKITQRINADIVEAKKADPNINDDSVWEFMDKNKITNVYEAVMKMKATDATPNKQVSAKVGGNSQNTTGKAQMSYEELHKMSWDDMDLPSNKK